MSKVCVCVGGGAYVKEYGFMYTYVYLYMYVCKLGWPLGEAAGWGTPLQAGRSRVRFFIRLNLPAM